MNEFERRWNANLADVKKKEGASLVDSVAECLNARVTCGSNTQNDFCATWWGFAAIFNKNYLNPSISRVGWPAETRLE